MKRRWFSVGHSLDEDARLAARALGMLYLAGGVIGLVSLQLPHSSRADLVGLYSNVALALAAGGVLLALAPRIRAWMLQVALAAGALIIARAVLLSGEASSFYSVWFIWVDLYAFYFFTRRTAVCHVAFVAVLYAALLAHDPPSSPVASWLTTVATLIVAGVFIDTLVGRARRQASAAAASADTMAQVALCQAKRSGRNRSALAGVPAQRVAAGGAAG